MGFNKKIWKISTTNIVSKLFEQRSMLVGINTIYSTLLEK
jgi:hypothetical protein